MAAKRRPETILERFGDPFGKENQALSGLGSAAASDREKGRKWVTLCAGGPARIPVHIHAQVKVDAGGEGQDDSKHRC